MIQAKYKWHFNLNHVNSTCRGSPLILKILPAAAGLIQTKYHWHFNHNHIIIKITKITVQTTKINQCNSNSRGWPDSDYSFLIQTVHCVTEQYFCKNQDLPDFAICRIIGAIISQITIM
jgi:hypothetical protein